MSCRYIIGEKRKNTMVIKTKYRVLEAMRENPFDYFNFITPYLKKCIFCTEITLLPAWCPVPGSRNRKEREGMTKEVEESVEETIKAISRATRAHIEQGSYERAIQLTNALSELIKAKANCRPESVYGGYSTAARIRY